VSCHEQPTLSSAWFPQPLRFQTLIKHPPIGVLTAAKPRGGTLLAHLQKADFALHLLS
jgi:hypothetical protein